MPIQSITSYAALAAVLAALACGGKAQPEDTPEPDEAAAARDTSTTGRDTLAGQAENPPGYRGMETDTTQAPAGQTPSDTFLQNQGQGTPQDTAGYTGMERTDTTGQVQDQTDTTGMTGGQDTSGMTGADTSTTNPSSATPTGDTTDMSEVGGDTTGYSPTQESRDTTNR
jgi:hypothetical protein